MWYWANCLEGASCPVLQYITVTHSFTNIEQLYIQERNGIWLTTISIFQWIDTAFDVEKVKTVNYILASSHHDRMRGAMLFCPGVIFCSSKQSLKLYESPIDKQHKHEQNLKNIMRQRNYSLWNHFLISGNHQFLGIGNLFQFPTSGNHSGEIRTVLSPCSIDGEFVPMVHSPCRPSHWWGRLTHHSNDIH